MHIGEPFFRKRPPHRGYGYDANGPAGWLLTAGFVAVLLATVIPAALLAKESRWAVCAPLVLAAVAETLGFVWFAKRESEGA